MEAIKKQHISLDRRQCPDVIVKSTKWTIAACWLTIFIACLFVYLAMPGRPSIHLSIDIARDARSYWAISMLKNAFIMVVVLFVTSLFGLAESILRHNRGVDKIPKTLIIAAIMSVVGMVVIYSYF
ncbi:MAG: hypothetical protein L7F77_12850 [Candidatus Magnetominusculus sp. LBB02]|nr:hypothetical protein [Candidatus Magnetominusculus sp. LBB02]